MGEFAYIDEGYADSLKKKDAPKEVSFTEKKINSQEIIGNVSKELRQKYLKPGEPYTDLQKALDETSQPRQLENVIEGTQNLINVVLQNKKDGNPVDTLLFLDKSARNGAYIFRLMWDELKDRKEISEDTTSPAIRFMNIGRGDSEKHENAALAEVLKETYKADDFEKKKVLVVDEYVASGGSLRQGMKTVEDVFNVIPSGVAQFSKVPGWYSNRSGVMGVTEMADSSKYDSETRAKLGSLDEEQLGELANITKKLDQEKFSTTINNISEWSHQNVGEEEMLQKISESGNKEIQIEDVKTLSDLSKTNLEGIDGGMIWEYVHSVGGYISKRLNEPEAINNNIVFRQMLRDIVQMYMQERDSKKEKKDKPKLFEIRSLKPCPTF